MITRLKAETSEEREGKEGSPPSASGGSTGVRRVTKCLPKKDGFRLAGRRGGNAGLPDDADTLRQREPAEAACK